MQTVGDSNLSRLPTASRLDLCPYDLFPGFSFPHPQRSPNPSADPIHCPKGTLPPHQKIILVRDANPNRCLRQKKIHSAGTSSTQPHLHPTHTTSATKNEQIRHPPIRCKSVSSSGAPNRPPKNDKRCTALTRLSSFKTGSMNAVPTALGYLNLLEELFRILSANREYRLMLIKFATGLTIQSWKDTSNELMLDTKLKQDKVIQLALMRRYPQLYNSEKISLEAKIQSLEKPLDAGERLLRNIIQPPQLSLDVVQKGFRSDYVGHDDIVTPTIKALEAWSSAWLQEIYFSPYTCLVGPTMMGKSRLLKELAKEVCVIYICLRPEGSTGEPPRSQLATEMLATPYSEDHYNRLIAAILSVALGFFEKATKTSDRTKLLKEWNKHQESIDSDFYSKVQSKFRKLADLDDAPSHLRSAAQSICKNNFFKSTELKVVLAIDEASALLELPLNKEVTRFQKFRRSLRNVPTCTSIFAVLVDTNSRIANFLPNSRYDRSSRDIGARGGKGLLYPPIYKIASFDVMVPLHEPENWNNLSLPERLCQYGVPFYSLYLGDALTLNEAATPAIVVNRMAMYALGKLLFCDNITEKIEITEAQALALLGPTIGVPLHGQARLNVELTSSHAAHCAYLDSTHEVQFSFYPSQPIYALAANNYLYKNERVLISCIDSLACVLSQGCVNTGEAGKFASRIILLCAMNKTVADLKTSNKALDQMGIDSLPDKLIEFPSPVPVAKFLETLTGVPANELPLGSINSYQKKRLLDEGMMFWNHFMHYTHTPTTGSLMEGLHRGLAMQCHHSQKSFDQILTIYLKDQSRDSLDKKDISFCGVQVKNVKNNADAKTLQSWMTPEHADINISAANPYLALLFDLEYSPITVKEARAAENFTKTYELPPHGEPDLRQASLVFYELDAFNFLSLELKQALKRLLTTNVDLLLHHKDELGIKYAKQFLLRSDASFQH
ncbi:hypothetical protein PGT21_001913 [Puccinia graminis f. sp. tritici]|uniref:Uncharacterized protein n=1 Tax=Puccinia graminis f. sp. tritici TaxID=56615 RepID=A0A5B0LHV1_PUCGR|nr:hypothetical protein PGT21_001913 [Puccinia graminis f. sp. tritici]